MARGLEWSIGLRLPLFYCGAVCAALFSSPAVWAQDLPYPDGAMEQCLADASSLAAAELCVGIAAEACIDAGGQYAPVMSECFARELEEWDALLNAEYQRALDGARAIDARVEIVQPLTHEQGLRAQQRAWIAYRDASCEFEAVQWLGGTGATPGFLRCMMQMTGEQAIHLSQIALRP